MKKTITKSGSTSETVGIDLGDRVTRYCKLDAQGRITEEDHMITCAQSLKVEFAGKPRMRIALEAGTHSPWVSRILRELGHDVIVANSRKLRMIYQSDKKNDRHDARMIARVARMDPELLAPIQHRGAEAQADLARIRARDSLVEARTQLINCVRGTVKSFGGRVPACSAASFPKQACHIPEMLLPALSPAIASIAELTSKIRSYNREIKRLGEQRYPEILVLRQVAGVGPLTGLAFVLIIEDPTRFEHSRDVGAYFGLRARLDESGQTRRQLGITKAGDPLMRKLLVNAAHYILGHFGPDCDLRRWGLELARRGGQNAKKRAVVAVARKLAVLLHRLWVTNATYQPLRQAQPQQAVAGTE